MNEPYRGIVITWAKLLLFHLFVAEPQLMLTAGPSGPMPGIPGQMYAPGMYQVPGAYPGAMPGYGMPMWAGCIWQNTNTWRFELSTSLGLSRVFRQKSMSRLILEKPNNYTVICNAPCGLPISILGVDQSVE